MESREYFFLFIVFIFQIFIVCDYGSSANAESNKLQENGLIHSLENNEEYVMRSNSPDSQKSVTGNEAVILLHGFGKSKSDMSTLKKYFESTGYHVICPTLPTTFQSGKIAQRNSNSCFMRLMVNMTGFILSDTAWEV